MAVRRSLCGWRTSSITFHTRCQVSDRSRGMALRVAGGAIFTLRFGFEMTTRLISLQRYFVPGKLDCRLKEASDFSDMGRLHGRQGYPPMRICAGPAAYSQCLAEPSNGKCCASSRFNGRRGLRSKRFRKQRAASVPARVGEPTGAPIDQDYGIANYAGALDDLYENECPVVHEDDSGGTRNHTEPGRHRAPEPKGSSGLACRRARPLNAMVQARLDRAQHAKPLPRGRVPFASARRGFDGTEPINPRIERTEPAFGAGSR